MFYDTSWVEAAPVPRDGARAVVALTPAESKRLIAKAVAALPEVRRARDQGRLVIARGTTNAFVVEELLGQPVGGNRYAAGIICQGTLGTVPPGERLRPIALKGGQPVAMTPQALLREFEAEDMFIKGANAVDPAGNAGILVASPIGGTIGSALATITARGSHLLVPVGLEKLVPSVVAASVRCGILRQKYATGLPVGLIPLVNAQVFTEVQALKVLAGVEATHVASGGMGGSEGSVVLAVEGSEEAVDRAWELLQGIKGEPPVPPPSQVSQEL